MRKIRYLIILSFLSIPLAAMLGSPDLNNLSVSDDTVYIYHYRTKKVLRLDFNGKFRSEVTLKGDEGWRLSTIRGIGREGHFLVRSCLRKNCKVVETRFSLFNSTGQPVAQERLKGCWEEYLNVDGSLYLYTIEEGQLSIYTFDIRNGSKQIKARFPMERIKEIKPSVSGRFSGLAIDSNENILLLVRLSERGYIKKYSKSGKILNRWVVLPDPVTSVAYINGIYLDASDNVYVTHKSWEASSSTANKGSIVKYDPVGNLIFRIKQPVGYLRELAVARDGTIFMYQLGNEIFKFSTGGQLLLKWNAVPPEFGLTWKERARRNREANTIKKDAPVHDLLNAIIFGDYLIRDKAVVWLVNRGPNVIPEVFDSWISFRDKKWNPLYAPAFELSGKYPGESFVYLRKLFLKGEPSLKEYIAIELADLLDGQEVKGLRQTLVKLFRDPGTTDYFSIEWALEKAGGKKSVTREYIRKLHQEPQSSETSLKAFQYFGENLEVTLPLIEPLLFDPDEPLRSEIRGLIIQSWEQFDENPPQPIPPKIVERVRQWMKVKDPYVNRTAALALIGFGIKIPPDKLAEILDVKKFPSTPLLISAFSSMAEKDVNYFEQSAKTLFKRAYQSALSSTDRSNDPLDALIKTGTPRIQELALDALKDNRTPADCRETIMMRFGYSVERLNNKTKMFLLENVSLFYREPNLVCSYSNFLEYLGEKEKKNPRLKEALRNAAVLVITGTLSDLSSTPRSKNKQESDLCILKKVLVQALHSLATVIEQKDFPVIRDLVLNRDTPLKAKEAALNLLVQIDVPPEFVKVLEGYFSNDRLALPAAKAAAKYRVPHALKILVDKGLKKMGYYSRIWPESSLFAPYGQEGIDTLISLMDYPNSITRGWVRILLAELKSQKAFHMIKNEFDHYMKRKEVPPGYLVGCMILYGQDVLPGVVDLLVQIGKGGIWHLYIDDSIIVEKLKAMLLDTSRIDRAKVIIKTLRMCSSQEAKRVLEELKDSHPNADIRGLIRNR